MSQADLLDRCDRFDAAVTKGDIKTMHIEFLQMANRCAQAMIMLRRAGIDIPPTDDPCWERWDADAQALLRETGR